MRSITRVASGLALFAVALVAHAGEKLNPECLRSFTVKKADVSIGGEKLSCEVIENWREKMFVQIDAMNTTPELKTAVAFKNSLDAMDAQLKNLDASNNALPVADVLGVFLATTSLTACFAGPGACVMSVVGKVLANYSFISNLTDQSKRQSAIKAAKERVAKDRAALGNLSQGKIDAGLSTSISQFNAMCATIRSSCL